MQLLRFSLPLISLPWSGLSQREVLTDQMGHPVGKNEQFLNHLAEGGGGDEEEEEGEEDEEEDGEDYEYEEGEDEGIIGDSYQRLLTFCHYTG